MLKKWVKYLCDPIDKTSLKIDRVVRKAGNDIIAGTLRSSSGKVYEIKNGVPVLLNQKTQPVKSVESFAYEWKSFDFDYGRKGWLKDIVTPVLGGARYFKSKTIIDCGSGSGRQSLWMAQSGAKFVFSIELSDSAMTMVKKVTDKFKDKIFVIQADIAHLPINKKTVNVDLMYCANVIQHTKNPKQATLEISETMNRNSSFIFNIYLRRGNLHLIDFIQLFRRAIKRLPNSMVKYISLIAAIFIYPLKSTAHSFKEFWLDIYDLLGSHSYQRFYSESYLAKMLKESNLKIIKRSYYAILLKRS